MNGISKYGYKMLDDFEHVKQSIEDILTTPIGSRVMNRRYGSRIYKYIDKPLNQLTLAKILNAILEAISIWEKRIRINEIKLSRSQLHHILLDIEFLYLINGKKANIRGIMI
ncbi:GPW/gp25 family protein [Thiotrichales bacterium 19S3-7]|nr:GPW/gp25 family protein [Thiotrichales bacterium 19S3-7]MCF6801277.1 GPW/gp25 family protein [Thiotrichales bacterium 19S3-11]